MKKAAKQMVSGLAALALVVTLSAPVLAESVPPETQPQPLTCPAHTEHDDTCGYQEGAEASLCTHTHDENCGYVEAVEGAPCTFVHQHDASCGWAEAVAGSPCTAENPDTHAHDETCGFVAEVAESPCTYDPASHVHKVNDAEGGREGPLGGDESCGYVEAVEGQPCTHQHDAECGYREGVEAVPCTHACELCAPALAEDSAPMMAPAQNGTAPTALPLPANGLGQPWDGIDFGALEGSGIYYGTYNHATGINNYNGYWPTESAAYPVLWRVMGEENGDGHLTVLSE